MLESNDGRTWLALTDVALPIGQVYDWCVRPNCGAVVLFSGIVRDHADGRSDVTHLEYEAYADMVLPKLADIDSAMRGSWSAIECVAILHRVGTLELGEAAVIAAVSSPHRPDAFAAAEFAIDALKRSVPIWKREIWAEGSGWGTGACELVPVADTRWGPPGGVVRP